MDRQLVAHLKSTFAGASSAEDKPESHDINYPKIQHISEQLAMCAKQVAQSNYVGLEDMDRLCQIWDVLQKELHHVRSDLARRKSLELLLPSPNTQHHLPCSSLLSPSSTPPSPTGQQSMAMSTGASTSTHNGLVSPSTTPNGSPNSPHGLNSLGMDSSSMSIPSTGVMQSDDYWRTRKMDPSKMVRRSPTPLYVNLTEQMILAQSSKRKRPAEGDLYCHNCKTKDTPEWRRGPMGAKTLCNACGIRWRLSQAEAAKQKKGEQSQAQIQYPAHLQLQQSQPQSQPQPSPQSQPQSQQQQQIVQQLQQQHMRQLHHQQQQILQQQQIQHLQQYSQSHHQHQQQHMVLPGHVGLAQENIPNRISLSGETNNRNTNSNSVISSLSMTPSPIAT